MSQLPSLIEGFRPQRLFLRPHARVEVDGVFVRVSKEGDTESWIPAEGGYLIKTEDLLQDPSIIRSARVSTDRDTTEVSEKAQGLVNFLHRDNHATPSEGGVMFRLRWETPISFAQPLFRLFASHNEFSGRYSKIDGSYYRPGFVEGDVATEFDRAEEEAQGLYEKLLSLGVAGEMARYVHLYRFYTKFYMTVSARELINFLSWQNVAERPGPDFAEVRELVGEILQTWTPWLSKANATHPRRLDFSWIQDQEYLGDGPIEKMSSLQQRFALDHGEVRVLDFYGNDDMCLAALDDFPNPAQAFDHAGITMYLKMPIHVFRQWVRHRKGHWTEFMPDFDRIVGDNLFYLPERFRKQEGKVGAYTYSPMNDDENAQVASLVKEHYVQCRKRYQRLVQNLRLLPTMAALNLPYSFYITALRTEPLGGAFNFLSLRADSHAQAEFKPYVAAEWHAVKTYFPKSAKIFAKYLHYGNNQEIKDYGLSE